MTRKIFITICLVTLFSVIASAGDNNSNTPLRFSKDGKFKIVQFTVVHWSADNPASDIAGERMNEVLDAENPDLVIYTGDLVFGAPAKEGYMKALEPVLKRKLPFAVTFGNHDDESGMSREELLALLKSLPGNLSTSTEGVSGVTNYVLTIGSASNAKKDAAVLYFFDSQSYTKIEELKHYTWIKRDQIDWYASCSNGFTAANGGTPLPSMAFFHIPLPEYNEAACNENAQMMGYRGEAACSPKINSGLFAAMRSQGDIIATFVGHDHVNDYLVNWRSIALCYGRYTGGGTVYNNIPGGNGARVIELTEGSRSFHTYIRIAGGKIINEITYPDDFQAK